MSMLIAFLFYVIGGIVCKKGVKEFMLIFVINLSGTNS